MASTSKTAGGQTLPPQSRGSKATPRTSASNGLHTKTKAKAKKVGASLQNLSHKNLPGSQAELPQPAVTVTKKKRPLQPIEQLLGEKMVNADGIRISPNKFSVEGGVIGLYFAAKWCPPCRALFPKLMLLYEEIRNKEEIAFEMVYVSFDMSVDSFNEYLAKMPWWAVVYEDSDRREDLADAYDVNGIPVFLLLDAVTLDVINKDGRVFLSLDPRGNKFPWRDLKPPTPSPTPSAAVIEALAAVEAAKSLLATSSASFNDNADNPVSNKSSTQVVEAETREDNDEE